MTEDTNPEESAARAAAGPCDVNQGSMGRVDWSPLAKLTGTRPLVSKYGLARYSPQEWRSAYASLIGNMPSAVALDRESKTLMAHAAHACDREQSENTLRLRQRAVDITAKNILVCHYSQELSAEVEQLERTKRQVRKALQFLEVVEGINSECREIRKNRFTEDLVRDTVEEELFQEKGLCQEVRQLINATLLEFESQFKVVKSCLSENHALWSDLKETLDLESENISLKSSSGKIAFVQGSARLDANMSTPELWEEHLDRHLTTMKDALEFSKSFRRKVKSLVLVDTGNALKQQDEKVVKAFLTRIGEVNNARMVLEVELEQVLKELAHADSIYASLTKLGRQLDFNLKVVQTRLDNRSRRPDPEKCRDKAQYGLLQEVKVISERVTALQTQIHKITESINQLKANRKKLERQIHVKRHSLSLDRDRCLKFRSKFPNTFLLGF